MFTVSRQIEIDAGHRVPYHDAQCRFLHGHRWKIVAEVAAPELVVADPSRADSGMVVDFGVIKRVLMTVIHERFDHRMILWDQDPLLAEDSVVDYGGDDPTLHGVLRRAGIEASIQVVPVIPTSEGLARYWAELVAPHLGPLQLAAFHVWETPNSKASFIPRRG